MIRQLEGGYEGGIIIPKDKFKEFVRSKGADDKVS